jgi:hypothetical protein
VIEQDYEEWEITPWTGKPYLVPKLGETRRRLVRKE